jgi:hypothetical protein
MPLSDAEEFEALVERLLAANGFVVQRRSSPGSELGFDVLVRLDDEEWAIEVKYYRTARAQLALVRAAASRLLLALRQYPRARGMLVVSSFLTREIRPALEREFGLAISDRNDLFRWMGNAPEVADRLVPLLEHGHADLDPGVGRELSTARDVAAQGPIAAPQVDTQGSALCSELHQLKPGNNTWAAYEKLCDRILRYLFPNDLHGWHRQKRTEDGLNRFDYVCRLRPQAEFWKFLVEQVATQYVLFEFKNYARMIKQGQVLTTEKYLLERGLRRTAIMLTRNGADPGARATMQGAMREHGKLILVIDDEKVCQMLHMKEKGEDPSDLLFEIADNFLMSLPR